MLKFIPRSERGSGDIKSLYQCCDVGRGRPSFLDDGTIHIFDHNCAFCRYRSTWSDYQEYKTCSLKHQCNGGLYPFIEMGNPINNSIYDYPVDPQGEEFYWRATGIFKQIKFEAVPLYVQLYVISSDQGRCNANCWYHAWRLANKRTWRQCGESHLCQNNGSLWFLMAPTDNDLYEDFISGNYTSIDAADFNDDFNIDFSK